MNLYPTRPKFICFILSLPLTMRRRISRADVCRADLRMQSNCRLQCSACPCAICASARITLVRSTMRRGHVCRNHDSRYKVSHQFAHNMQRSCTAETVALGIRNVSMRYGYAAVRRCQNRTPRHTHRINSPRICGAVRCCPNLIPRHTHRINSPRMHSARPGLMPSPAQG